MNRKKTGIANTSVLHVIDHMGLGGAQRAVADQIKYRPHDRVFILNGKKKNLYSNVRPEYSGTKNIIELFLLLLRLLICVKAGEFQIIHCHLDASWLFGLMAKLWYGRRIKIIFHERGAILTNGFFYRALVRLCASNGTIVAISKNIAHHLNRAGIPNEQIIVIYNGLETSSFFQNKYPARSFRKEHDIPEQVYLIGFAGRLEKYKGWKDYLDALYLVNKEFNDVFGIIAGTGPDAKSIIAYIKALNLTEKIANIGYAENMVDCYNAMDVLIFPSHLEPLGRVQLEAQACGVPVIATDIPGTIETVSENNALIVKPHSPQGIANAIHMLRRKPELADKLTRSGFGNIKRFNYSHHLIQITNLYQTLSIKGE